jgi:hypothetical protein
MLSVGAMIFENQLDLIAGEYKIKFVVFDRLTGRIGTVAMPLTVENQNRASDGK